MNDKLIRQALMSGSLLLDSPTPKKLEHLDGRITSEGQRAVAPARGKLGGKEWLERDAYERVLDEDPGLARRLLNVLQGGPPIPELPMGGAGA